MAMFRHGTFVTALAGCLRYSRTGLGAVGAAIIAISLASTALAEPYTVTDLGAGYASGINNAGQVSGYTPILYGYNYAAWIYNGSRQDISSVVTSGWIEGYHYSRFEKTTDINSSGDVVGFASSPIGKDRAVRYSPTGGYVQFMGTLGGPNSYANGVNDSGLTCGGATTGTEWHAFLYNSGMQDLGVLPGGTGSEAYGINKWDTVVGVSYATSGSQAFRVYLGGSMEGLGTLGGDSSTAYDINDAEKIVGSSRTTSSLIHAFLYDGTMHDIDTLGSAESCANSINSSNEIVGYLSLTGGSDKSAFLYSDGAMRDLNSLVAPGSGWIFQSAEAINDSGQIVGYGTYQGSTHAFLLTQTPEPSVAVLLATGLASLIFVAWRRRRLSE